MSHGCHAHECNTQVPPSMLMCRRHWFLLPKNLQRAVWREYRPGQENDKQASRRYLAVQRLAVSRVAFKPHDEVAARVSAAYLDAALSYQREAIEAGDGDPLDGLLAEPRR